MGELHDIKDCRRTKSFYDLFVWKKSHEFVMKVYSACREFPDFEKFGLCSQFTRAAVSVPANIAEGYRRKSKNDKLRFLNYSLTSLDECKYYILLARDLNYVEKECYSELCVLAKETGKLITCYEAAIKSKNPTP